MPFALTEQRVAKLSSVLKSDKASLTNRKKLNNIISGNTLKMIKLQYIAASLFKSFKVNNSSTVSKILIKLFGYK